MSNLDQRKCFERCGSAICCPNMDLTRLVSIVEVMKICGISRTTLWRLRRRHGIRLLPGRKIHLDDMDRAYEAERGLKR